MDPEIEASINVLAQEVAKVKQKLGEVETEMTKAQGPSIKRDELIARLGSLITTRMTCDGRPPTSTLVSCS